MFPMAMEILFIEFHDFWLLLDRIVATNGIQAPNPPLTTAIFAYVAQIGECYIPFWPNIDYLYHGISLYRARPGVQIVQGHAKGSPQFLEGTEERKSSN